MLLRDEIESLKLVQMEDGSPPPGNYFDVTSYNLRLGQEYCLISGTGQVQEVGDCSQGTGTLRLPPFACALVSSKEVIKLPDDVAGRWGLKIRPAMSGLVFQAGPQIEPGSHSRLFGLLFNLSSSERTLHHEQKLWSVDFERLASPIPSQGSKSGPQLRMQEFTQNGLPAGSINEIYSEYKKLQKDVSSRRDLGVAVLMAVITLVISITVPVVITRLVSDSAETARTQQELKDRVANLENRLNQTPPPAGPAPATTRPVPART